MEKLFGKKSPLASNGQILGQAPVFSPEGEEIMHVKDNLPGVDADYIQYSYEDPEHPGSLLTGFMHRKDYEQILRSQR